MNPIALKVLTPNGLAYEGDVLEVYVPTRKGPLGVLPGHTSYIAPLADYGVLRLIDKEHATRYFGLSHGVLEVKPETTIVLSECAYGAPSAEAALLLAKKDPAVAKDDHSVLSAQAALASHVSQ